MAIRKWFRPYRAVILLFILAALVLRIPVLKVRFFDPDEFQHLHGARQIYRDQIPYRDYFEHHTPFLHFVLAGFYPVFGEEIRILFAARTLMMILTMAILYLTYLLAKTLYGTDTGLFAALFLSYIIMFLEKTIEVRPDVPAVVFWLASLIFLVKGIQQSSALAAQYINLHPRPPFPPSPHSALPSSFFIYSGLMIGIAIMFTQKTLFALSGVIIALAWMLLDPRVRIPRKRLIELIAIFLASAMVPVILTCLFFYARGGLWDFINCNFIMNSRWKTKFWPYNNIKQMLSQNPFFSVISVCGLLLATFWLHRREEIIKGRFVPVLSTYALIAGLFIMPVPYRQYYQLFLPLLAIYCGLIFIRGIDFRHLISGISNRRWRPVSVGLIILAFAVAGLIYTLRMGKPNVFGSTTIYLVIWAALLVLAILALIFKRREYAALFISIGIIAYPLDQTVAQLSRKNTGQLANVKYIMDVTTEEDTVLDGWSGYGFLRSHAYYYFFLHPEVRAMLSEKERSDDLIESLEEKPAKVVIYDSSIKALPEKVQKHIRTNYKASGQGSIWLRNN